VARVCFAGRHRPYGAASRRGRMALPQGHDVTAGPLARPGLRAGYRQLAVLAAAMLAVWAGVSPASAHNTLTSTDPADQETVQSAPQAVVLTFDEPAIAMGTQVVVTGPSGQVQQGPAGLAGKTITQDLQPGAPAGTYTVAWRVTSADGHPVSGAFSFTVKTAAATQLPTSPQASPSATSTPAQPALLPGWLKLVIGVVAIIFGVTVARRASRRGNGSRPD
jgi:methionine-rich copper-binding protein CopC